LAQESHGRPRRCLGITPEPCTSALGRIKSGSSAPAQLLRYGIPLGPVLRVVRATRVRRGDSDPAR
jgi:hypothetical protein